MLNTHDDSNSEHDTIEIQGEETLAEICNQSLAVAELHFVLAQDAYLLDPYSRKTRLALRRAFDVVTYRRRCQRETQQ